MLGSVECLYALFRCPAREELLYPQCNLLPPRGRLSVFSCFCCTQVGFALLVQQCHEHGRNPTVPSLKDSVNPLDLSSPLSLWLHGEEWVRMGSACLLRGFPCLESSRVGEKNQCIGRQTMGEQSWGLQVWSGGCWALLLVLSNTSQRKELGLRRSCPGESPW